MSIAGIKTPLDGEEIFKDKQVLEVKKKMMNKLKWNSMLLSISDTCKFVAGPMFSIGAGSLITALTVASASAVALPLGIGLMAVAGAMLATAVACGYASSRIWHSGQFDNLEENARSTARHLVEELRQNNMCVIEHEQNKRADGKTWVQAVTRSGQPLQPQQG